ncbi:2-iminobutanoate/2-iminopropanoate deaminase [Caprobacter fermentans]|uniref:2-iminobutanoate/2-iminopropanoate deaminase n=1 Tax=Caproicibacter fermentans TaxID=2576756 RepID=A0A6N8I3W5_9FIRM|nr:RidA family protein [Caproicibacter fermentans]MVB12659.1 2-iminobutanoate/2-iminopropanoate deaminase [Caproicibacter fermentans]OCM99941.1 regulator [Clostridium sp. W14A]
MKKTVYTGKAPEAIGPYSQAVVAGNLVFTSGQIPIVPETGTIAQGDISAQAEQSIQNVGEILKAAGAGFGDVVKTTCFLKDMNDFVAFNAVYAKYFTGKPARSCVAVRELPKGALVEVEAVAVLGE